MKNVKGANDTEYQLWPYGQDFYKVFVQEEAVRDEILAWDECSLHCRYYNIKGKRGWDIIFPAKYCKQIERLLKSRTGK